MMTNMNLNGFCVCMCIYVNVYLPGSLAKMDSAKSQTISSLLLAPSWTEEQGFTSIMVLIRVTVSCRCRCKYTKTQGSIQMKSSEQF